MCGLRGLPIVSRCHTCACFSARMRKDLTSQQRADVLEAQRQHLANIMQYRKVQTRLNCMSEESTAVGGGGTGSTAGVLKMDLDYCDQSKFRVPRNVSSSKNLDNLWRPQISLGGCLIWGVPALAFG